MSLTFRDIGEWKPSSISIVDSPSHPLAVFEVYEEDDEFIRKYADSGVIMTDNNIEDNNKVSLSEGLLERLLGRGVSKSEPIEPPAQPPAKEEDVGKRIDELEVKVDEILSIITKEEPVKDKPKEGENPVSGAVKKYIEVKGEKFYLEPEKKGKPELEILENGVIKNLFV